jgi:hypothetical protein
MECTKLSTITFEKNSSLKTIGPGAFAITNIKSIIIPSFVTSIGNQAFQECSNLSSVTLPLSLKNIDNSAFSNCPKLTFIKIPSSVESIGNQAFLGCSTYDKKIKGYIACKPPTGLSSVIFISPSSLKTIGESAFSFSALTKIIIPSSVNSIGSYAFAECHKLSTFIFGSGTKSSLITIGDNAFNCCTSLTSIEIPASVKTIEKDTIWGCTKLSSITFEKGSKLSKISSDAFTKCPIKNVTNLPSKIDKSVFKSSTNYKNIQYK